MTAYYNEIDPYAAQWLRNLIDAGHIAPGIVDTRSIEDVHPSDLRGFTQCHFFAGIGVWSYALRRAGWSDDRPVWTGSCPCQPFSSAGKGAGFDDERHLWPAFETLIQQCRPPTVIGEQVASKDGLAWIDLVLSDLDGQGYAAAAVDTCSAGFGAPHIRQRLYWVANANHQRLQGWGAMQRSADKCTARKDGLAGKLGHARHHNDTSQVQATDHWHPQADRPANQHGRSSSALGRVGDTDSYGCAASSTCRPGPTNGYWRDADWLYCSDGKWRPVEPGTFPLAHGAPARVGRVRAYGNAINAQAAQAFIECLL